MHKFINMSVIALLLGTIYLSAYGAPKANELQNARTALSMPVPTKGKFLPEAFHNKSTLLRKSRYCKGTTRTSVEMPSLKGYLIYSTSVQLNPGWYDITPAGASNFQWSASVLGNGYELQAGWYEGGRVCGYFSQYGDNDLTGYKYAELDADNGQILRSIDIDAISHYNLETISCVYDPSNGTIYGFNYNASGDGYQFVKSSDSNPGKFTVICDFEGADIPRAMCWRSDADAIYGFLIDGTLVTLGTDGTIQKIADTGLPRLRYLSSMCWDPVQQQYFLNISSEDNDENPTSQLYSIPASGQGSSLLSDFLNTETFALITTMAQDTRPEAPEAPQFVSSDFDGADLFGTITFRLPARLENGNAIEGNVKWQVFDGDIPVANGSAAAGSETVVELKDLNQGEHIISMTAFFNDYQSKRCRHQLYVGYDTPLAPENINVDGNKVSWSKVNSSEHGGYVNYGNIEYSVYLTDPYDYEGLLPEPRLVGTTKNDSFVINIDENKVYSAYRVYVKASANRMTSSKSQTVKFRYGKPYELKDGTTFYLRPYEDQADAMFVKTYSGLGWKYDSSAYEWFSGFCDDTQSDSWLILPPVNISDVSSKYNFEFQAALSEATHNKEFVEVYVGKEPDTASMHKLIVEKCGPVKTDLETLSSNFAFDEPGVYYIAFRCVSDAGMASLAATKFRLTKTSETSSAPAAAVIENVVPGTEGALYADVKFTMPTKTLDGKDLPADANVKATVIGNGEEKVDGIPGSRQSVRVKTFQNETNIMIVCETGGNNGATAFRRVSCGVGVPGAVREIKSMVDESNRTVSISWKAPDESADGRYFLPQGISYYLVDGFYFQWVVSDFLGLDIDEASYTIPDYLQRLYQMRLGVIAENQAGMSPYFASVFPIMGDPCKLPIEEYFMSDSGHYTSECFTNSTTGYSDNWGLYYTSSIGEGFDNETGAAYMNYPDKSGQKSGFYMPKFSTTGMSSALLDLSMWTGTRCAPTSILARTYGMEDWITLKTLDGTGKGWESMKLELPEKLLDKNWVEIYILSDFKDINQIVMMDYFSISGSSSVNETETVSPEITVTEGVMTIKAASGTTVEVWNLQGIRLLHGTCNDSSITLTPGSGVYVVKAGSTTSKVII